MITMMRIEKTTSLIRLAASSAGDFRKPSDRISQLGES